MQIRLFEWGEACWRVSIGIPLKWKLERRSNGKWLSVEVWIISSWFVEAPFPSIGIQWFRQKNHEHDIKKKNKKSPEKRKVQHILPIFVHRKSWNSFCHTWWVWAWWKDSSELLLHFSPQAWKVDFTQEMKLNALNKVPIEEPGQSCTMMRKTLFKKWFDANFFFCYNSA